jgi:hypothetical protein
MFGLEMIAIGVFVFVSLTVHGWRVLDERERLRREAERKRPVITHYRGPLFGRDNRPGDN